MAEKSKKKDDKKNAPAVEPTPEPRMEEKPLPDPAASVPPAPHPRRGTAKRAKPRLAQVSAQASATGTEPLSIPTFLRYHAVYRQYEMEVCR